MAFGGDPHRVLGLMPGATIGEIKQAYRRLAKAHHPDAAGEAAIPRFLAIQAAYDELMGASSPGGGPGAGPRRGRRPGGRSSWWADPDRATRARRPPRGEAGAGPETDAGRRRRTGDRPGWNGRPPDRATPGSTTYDEAELDPSDREWSGASWYGTTSGTYWRINPREYADPRKHGPEYQARARRRSADETGDAAADDQAAPEAEPGTWRTTGAAEPADAGATPSAATPSPADPLAALPLPAGPGRRVAVALLGWPPLGIGLAWLLGELSGCGRFAAGCVETFAVGTWVGQVAVLALLLAVPALASASAVGSLAALAASIPAAVLLSAAGGSYDPAGAGAVLAVVLGLAWLGGVVFALVWRAQPRPAGHGPQPPP